MSANRLASAIQVREGKTGSPPSYRGERAVTAETAVRLGRYLGTGPAFWMNLQSAYDISVVESVKGRVIEGEVPAAVS